MNEKKIMNFERQSPCVINGVFEIFVHSPHGWHVALRISRSEKILKLKQKLQDRKYIQNGFKLVFGGVELEDDKTLREYFIRDGSRIDIVEQGGPWFKIHIETVDQKTCYVDVETNETVAIMKMKISKKIGISPEEQILWFEEELLNDDARTLDEYGIGPQSEIIAVSCLRQSWPIYITGFDGRSCTIAVDINETVGELKSKVYQKLEINIEDQILMFQSVTLEDARRLNEYGIKQNSVVVVRLRIPICLRTMDMKTFTIASFNNETVLDLKRKIQEKIRLAPDEQKLVFQGAKLEDARTVEEYRICETSVINVVALIRPEFQIFIKTMDGHTYCIGSSRFETVLDLKRKIHEKMGLTPDEQKLVFQGGILEDARTVEEYRICENSVINVVAYFRPESRIQISTMDGITYSIGFSKRGTISDLKRKLEERTGLTPDGQKLVFQGAILEDARTVEEYQINENSKIYLVARLRRGFQIFVKTINGQTICVEVHAAMTVGDLKKKIYEKLGICTEEQILEFENIMLDDDARTVEEYKICEKSVINVVTLIRPEFKIFIRTMDGHTYCIGSTRTETVLDLKRKIHGKMGLVPDGQKLVFQGGILVDARTVEDYQICENSVINLVALTRFPLSIKTRDGQTFTVEVHGKETVCELKRKIQEKLGIAIQEHKLVFEGKVLDNDTRTLDEYRIMEKSSITISRRERNIGILKMIFGSFSEH